MLGKIIMDNWCYMRIVKRAIVDDDITLVLGDNVVKTKGDYHNQRLTQQFIDGLETRKEHPAVSALVSITYYALHPISAGKINAYTANMLAKSK